MASVTSSAPAAKRASRGTVSEVLVNLEDKVSEGSPVVVLETTAADEKLAIHLVWVTVVGSALRATVSVSSWYTLAFGVAWWREEVKNTFITDLSSRVFPLQRDQEGIYLENRFHFGKRLYINAREIHGDLQQARRKRFQSPASRAPQRCR